MVQGLLLAIVSGVVKVPEGVLMVRPPPLGVGRCSGASPKGEEGGRELHGNGWNGWNGLAPPFSSCAVAPEIGRPGERSRGKEEHHATAALRSHHHWLDAPPRIFMPQSS